MKNFNVIYVCFMGFMTVFCVQGMDEPQSPLAKQILGLTNKFIGPSLGENRSYLLEELSGIQRQNPRYIFQLIHNQITPENQDWLNRVINYNIQTNTKENLTEIEDDIRKLRSLVISHNTNLACTELQNTFTDTEIKDSLYAKELIEILKRKSGHRESLIDGLYNKMFPKLSSEKPNLVGAKIVLSIACDNQYFTQYHDQVETIKQSESPQQEKKQSLTNVYNQLDALKGLINNNRETMADILRIQTNIKKIYKELTNKPQQEFSQPKSPVLPDELGKSQLPIINSSDFENSFNDLNASCILSDNDMQDFDQSQAFDLFTKASQNLATSIAFLLKDQSVQTKNNIIQSLDEMSAYVYKYDLTPKEESAPYKSYRCWLLELIKNVIVTNNIFTQPMIDDWKIQLEAIAQETEKRFNHPNLASIEASELAVTKAIEEKKKKPTKSLTTIHAAKKILTEEASSQDLANKTKLKNEIDRLDQELKKTNVFDMAKLSEYLKALKAYKKLLSSSEKKEQKRINQLIKTTANKIKRLTIIKPRTKTWEEQFSIELKGISAAKTSEELKKTIIDLQEHLPIGDYDASQVITQDSAIYGELLIALNSCIGQLAKQEKSAITKDSNLPINYFKDFTLQITLFENLKNQAQNRVNEGWISSIIQHYQDIINHAANILIKQIKNDKFFSETSLKNKEKMIDYYFGNDNTLESYFTEANNVLQAKIRQEKIAERIKQVESPLTPPKSEVPQIPMGQSDSSARPTEQTVFVPSTVQRLKPAIPQIPLESQETRQIEFPTPTKEQVKPETAESIVPYQISDEDQKLIDQLKNYNDKISEQRHRDIPDEELRNFITFFEQYIDKLNRDLAALKPRAKSPALLSQQQRLESQLEQYKNDLKNIKKFFDQRSLIKNSIIEINGCHEEPLFDIIKSNLSLCAQKVMDEVIKLAENIQFASSEDIIAISKMMAKNALLKSLINNQKVMEKPYAKQFDEKLAMTKGYAFKEAYKKIDAMVPQFSEPEKKLEDLTNDPIRLEEYLERDAELTPKQPTLFTRVQTSVQNLRKFVSQLWNNLTSLIFNIGG